MTFHTRILSSRPTTNSYRTGQPVDVERVWTLAEQASMAQDLADMRQRLATLPVIEQSKGLLMGHYGIDADPAFALRWRWSSHTNLKLRDISRMLVDAATPPTDPDHPNGLAEIIHSLQESTPATSN